MSEDPNLDSLFESPLMAADEVMRRRSSSNTHRSDSTRSSTRSNTRSTKNNNNDPADDITVATSNNNHHHDDNLVAATSSKNERLSNIRTTSQQHSGDIESIAGYVSGEYPCVYSNVNGTLYAGSNALYFVGSFFLFDKKVSMVWENVRKVEIMTTVNQGIEVIMNSDGGNTDRIVHQFYDVAHPDRVWALLVSLHNDALVGKQGRRHSITPASLKRRNSDPLLTSKIHHPLDETLFEDLLEDDDYEDDEQDKEDKKKENAVKMDIPERSITDSFIMSTAGLDMNSVENIAGKLSLQPIPCTYDGTKGKLFAGKGAIYFYGRRFWWDSKEILLKWESIVQIKILDGAKKNDGSADDDPNIGLGIRFVTKDETDYSFVDMDSAPTVWQSLVPLHNAHLTTGRTTATSTAATARARRQTRAITRSNSDPYQVLLTSSESTDGPVTIQSASVVQQALPHISIRAGGDGEKADDTAATTEEEVGDDKLDWSKLKDESVYSNLVVEEHELNNCNLDKFFELFLRDDAEFSIANFLESRGDSDLRTSSWEKDGAHSKNRIVSYVHPVNAPMAPPQASARKEQKFRRYGEHGMAVWTKTIVDDVPMADCFYVADRMRVVPSGDNSVTVSMELEITFVKSTMFKGIISRTSLSEFKKLFLDLAEYMSSALGETVVHVVEREEEPAATAAAGKPPIITFLQSIREQASITLLATILMMQFWIMVELRGVKQDLREVKEFQAELSNDAASTCYSGPPSSFGAFQ